MVPHNGPDETGKPGTGGSDKPALRDDDLERRRRELEATLATRLPGKQSGDDARSSGKAGYGLALKLSSEFIAAIAVGVGLGWLIDRVAGTSPWGLIIFLLLGFVAGVLNVLRSAGLVAEVGPKPPQGGGGTTS